MLSVEDELKAAVDGMGEHAGYFGWFTRYQTTGAIPNGTRITKVAAEEGDAHPVGTGGIVLGSLRHPETGFGYFVAWDPKPGYAVFVAGLKIEAQATLDGERKEFLDKVKVVSDVEAEEAGVMVCVPADWATPFTDNELGVCSKCGCAVQFRPHAPKKPPRLCVTCMLKMSSN